MKLSLFCVIILSLHVLTIASKFDYPSALNYDEWVCEYVEDNNVGVAKVKETDKWNTSKVNAPGLQAEGYDVQAKFPTDQVTVPSDDETEEEGDPGAVISGVCNGIAGKCQKEDVDHENNTAAYK